MNLWETAISVCIDILDRRKFTKKLPATHGGIFYDYVCSKYDVTFTDEEKSKIWNEVINDYREKNSSYPDLFKTNLNCNNTCINLYKSEMVRIFLDKNRDIFNKIKPNKDVNEIN